MTHAVIGLFDNYSDANEAVETLKSNGFPSGEIDISKRQTERKPDWEKEHEERTGENSVTRFFRNLFGGDDDNAHKYSNLAYDLGTVVSVYCNSEVQANQAADILDDCGAVDVEDRSNSNLKMGSAHETSDLPNATPGHTDTNHPDHKTPLVTQETTRMDRATGPGTGVEETGGSRSKSRVIQWQGEASAKLREDRLNETKFW